MQNWTEIKPETALSTCSQMTIARKPLTTASYMSHTDYNKSNCSTIFWKDSTDNFVQRNTDKDSAVLGSWFLPQTTNSQPKKTRRSINLETTVKPKRKKWDTTKPLRFNQTYQRLIINHELHSPPQLKHNDPWYWTTTLSLIHNTYSSWSKSNTWLWDPTIDTPPVSPPYAPNAGFTLASQLRGKLTDLSTIKSIQTWS
jgi:hypothetical protein